MLQNEEYILVDNEQSLECLLQELKFYEMAAIDTEADSMHHYHTKLCLIQITIGEHHYIVDPLSGIDISRLFQSKAMENLIFHGADYDLRLLWQTYQFSPKKIFDTMLAAKFLGEEHLGLADLVKKYFGDELKKENQKADWSIRPLPLEMCEYAIHDTFYLHELCAILSERLKKMGRLQWVLEQCQILIEHTQKKPHQKAEPWRVPGSNILPTKGLNILKHIWFWRETEAEKINRPPYKVMSSELMLAVVQHVLQNYPHIKLKKLPKLPKNFKEERLNSFLNMLQKAVRTPEKEYPTRHLQGAPPEVIPHSELHTLLKNWREKKAQELNLDPSLIANKNQIQWLSVAGDIPWEYRYEKAHLLNWQKKIWNQILQENLNQTERISRK